jgi:titin
MMKRKSLLTVLLILSTSCLLHTPVISGKTVTLLWSRLIPSTGEPIESPILNDGKVYVIDVCNVFLYEESSNLAADVQYYTTSSEDHWQWENHFMAPDEQSFLQINEESVYWGPFSNGDTWHGYYIEYTGTGESIFFQIVDLMDYDYSNNKGQLRVRIFTINPPVITIISPEMEKTYYTSDVPLTYSVDVPTDWEGYSLDGAENVTLTGDTILYGLSIGAHSLTVYASDTYGNMGWSSVYFEVAEELDETPPVVTIISPTSKTYETSTIPTSIPLTYQVDEPTDWEGYSLDGAENVTLTGDTILSELQSGSHTLIVYAEDTSGNTGHDSVTFTVMKEKKDTPKPPKNVAPEPVTLHDPTEITETSMMLTWTENEDFDFKKYILYYSTSEDDIGQEAADITDRSDTSYQMTGLSEDTRYYFVVRVEDTGGKSSDSNQVSATTLASEGEPSITDDTPPILTIISPTNTIYQQFNIELTWLVNEPLDWSGYALNRGVNNTISGNTTITDLIDGIYDLTLYATDLQGNTAHQNVTFEISTFIPDTEPPTIIHSPVTEGTEGLAIEISAIVYDETGVEECAVYYRKTGITEYLRLEMVNSPINSDTYISTIPASFVDAENIEYYIFASDGINSGAHPAGAPESSPHSVNVNLYPDPVTVYDPASEEITETTVELAWSESNAADFDNYSVFVSNTEEVLGETRETLTERSQTSYTVEDLSPDTDYYFTVMVSDEGGLSSASNQISVRTESAATTLPWTTYASVFVIVVAGAGLLLGLRKLDRI